MRVYERGNDILESAFLLNRDNAERQQLPHKMKAPDAAHRASMAG